MTIRTRMCLTGLLSLAALAGGGCRSATPRSVQQSYLRSQQLYLQNRNMAGMQDQMSQSLAQTQAEKAQLEQQNMALRNGLDNANRRLDNALAANSQLEDKYRHMLTTNKSPLPADASRRLEDLKKRYPEFDFDPQTGVSKFQADLLFDSGSDQIRGDANALLAEFARVMNENDARHLKILVVGHTDDRPIGRSNTRNEHPTNWHLSTDRANSVILSLRKNGISENRMGAAGHSMFKPLAPNSDEKARQKNRRVEIYVLAPDAVVAGWDPLSELK